MSGRQQVSTAHTRAFELWGQTVPPLVGWEAGLLMGWRARRANGRDHWILIGASCVPVGLRWPATPGVTLLGDAAHLMSPFAGEGANLALHDACELALAIVGAQGDLHTALEKYEQALFDRATPRAAESAANLELCFSTDGARAMGALLNGQDGNGGGNATRTPQAPQIQQAAR
ncbi:FAD-dependent oxidoreductase [Streptomyces gossypii]|uniref:FAD-dependent oxidoreductase n=1 Tax=Streptomyces gossypii TaxID=2883101 RepID=UPI0035CCE959